MTQIEKDTETKKLQAAAKDYQAEIGFITMQAAAGKKRLEALTVLMLEGERLFQVLQQTAVTEAPTAPVTEVTPNA